MTDGGPLKTIIEAYVRPTVLAVVGAVILGGVGFYIKTVTDSAVMKEDFNYLRAGQDELKMLIRTYMSHMENLESRLTMVEQRQSDHEKVDDARLPPWRGKP